MESLVTGNDLQTGDLEIRSPVKGADRCTMDGKWSDRHVNVSLLNYL